MTYSASRALELLRLGTRHPEADFRDDQETAIRHVVEGRGRLLVVQKTGWGKSSVYFIATKLLRESGAGPALLISPLLALMRNQITAAERMGVRALTINSENRDQWPEVEAALNRNDIDILLISPERLANERFRTEVMGRVAGRISLMVVDEAHCISDWGHDFRPHYRFLERIVRTLPPNLRLLATTATANNRVLADLQTVLGPKLTVSRGELARPSLFLQTMRLATQPERLAWLAQEVAKLPGSGIIYTLTVRDAGQVAEWLRANGVNVETYTGATGDRRAELEEALLANRVKALVATTALGMGYDKPDLAFVVHFQSPGSVVAYYQQVGRAGRALPAAYGVLLSGDEETDINNYFIAAAFPSREVVKDVLAALKAAPNGLSGNDLLAMVNATKNHIEKALLLLSLESPAPVVKLETKWQLTASPLAESFWQRADRLTSLRRAEQRQMEDYVALRDGHMEYLIRALDGDPTKFQPPKLPALPASVDPELVEKAAAFLRRTNLPLEPRKRWPPGGLPGMGLVGNTAIAAKRQAQPGRVLCLWGDEGLAEQVQAGKKTGRFGEELVDACAGIVAHWKPRPNLAWITCVPSLAQPELLPDFSRRLARLLKLPFHAVLTRSEPGAGSKNLNNSSQQVRQLDGAFVLAVRSLPPGPCLLVDDLVSSRWRLAVAAWLLTSQGGGPIYPLALASMPPTE